MERRFLYDLRKNNSYFAPLLDWYKFNIRRLQSQFDNPIDKKKKKQIKSCENDVGELRLWCTRKDVRTSRKSLATDTFFPLVCSLFYCRRFYCDSLSCKSRIYVIQSLETSELQLSPCFAIISFSCFVFCCCCCCFFFYSRCARKICILQMKTTHVRRRPPNLKLTRMVQPLLSTSHLLTARTTNGM